MAVAGRKPKPHLASVREGTYRADRNSPGVVFAPSDVQAPDWEEVLPGGSDAHASVRAKALETWTRVIPALVSSAGLNDTQRETAIDFCVTVARIWEGERALSRDGVVVETERGRVKNPWVTVLQQYRSHFRSLIGELGLSPASATRIAAPGNAGDDDLTDVFD